METGARLDAKIQVKRGGKGGETAAGLEDGVEQKRPRRRRVASAKTGEPSGADETSKTNLETVKATREPQREEELVQRGRGTPPTAAPQPRRRVRKAAESSSSRGQPAAEGAAPTPGLRRSKRIANRKR